MIALNYILPPAEGSDSKRSFITFHRNPDSFEDYRNKYASLDISQNEAAADEELDKKLSKKQLGQILWDFIHRYDKEARDKTFKTFAYVPYYDGKHSWSTHGKAAVLNHWPLHRPLFSWKGAAKQEYYIGDNNKYIEIDIDVSSGAEGYTGPNDPSTYVAPFLEDAPHLRVDISLIAETPTSEAVAFGITLDQPTLGVGSGIVNLDEEDAIPQDQVETPQADDPGIATQEPSTTVTIEDSDGDYESDIQQRQPTRCLIQ